MAIIINELLNKLQRWITLLIKRFIYNKKHHCKKVKTLEQPQLIEPQPEKPYCRYAPKPQWVLDEIIRLCALMKELGARKIAEAFNAKYKTNRNMTVSHQYVTNKRRDHEYEIVQKRSNIKHRIPKIVANNLTWGIDLMTITDNQQHQNKVMGIIDYGSRANLLLKQTTTKTSITLIRLLLDTIEQYGKPKIIRTDNESCFTSKLFRLCLWSLNIKHQRSAPYCPWENGRIERLFGTLRERIKQIVINTNEMDSRLAEFRLWYNHVRTHQHLHGNTPANQWNGQSFNNKEIAYDFRLWQGVLSGLYVPPD